MYADGVLELSPSAPVLYNTIAPSNVQPTQRLEWAEDMVAQYKYTIRSTANGIDTYILSVEWSKMNMKPMEEQNLLFHSDEAKVAAADTATLRVLRGLLELLAEYSAAI